MKIYNAEPDGNEASEDQVAHYFNLSINEINEESNSLLTRKEPVDALRLHIEVLLLLSSKYPFVADILVEQEDVLQWKSKYFTWYDKIKGKIPSKYRNDIKKSAEDLFSKLEKIGY